MPQTGSAPRVQDAPGRASTSPRHDVNPSAESMGTSSGFRTAATDLRRQVGPDKESTKDKTTLCAEEACAAADRLSQQIRQADPSSPEVKRLHQQRDLLTHCLIANDVYSEGKGPAMLPAHIIRLRGETLKLFVGSKLTEQMLENDKVGYFGSVYLDRESSVFILANRGTENLPDWINNVQQAPGLKSRQYSMAIEAAIALKQAVLEKHGPSIPVVFNGHSLGGGLASAQAIVTNSPAITFNAAGLNQRTVERYDSTLIEQRAQNIQAYRVKSEILTTFQDRANNALGIFGDALVPEAAGQAITIDPGSRASSIPVPGLNESTARHKMGTVIRAALRATEADNLVPRR
jgi:hypothetical protein